MQERNTETPLNVNVKKYLFKGLRSWYLFVIAIAISLVWASYKNRYVIPNYYSTVSIMLNTQVQPEAIVGGLRIGGGSNMENEIAILKTINMHKNTLERVDMQTSYYQIGRTSSNREIYKNSPFVVEYDSSHRQVVGVLYQIQFDDNLVDYNIYWNDDKNSLSCKLNQWQETDAYRFRIVPRDLSSFNPNTSVRYGFIHYDFIGLAASYARNLYVNPQKGTSILKLSLQGEVPQKMNDYLNTLVEVYSDYGLQKKNDIANKIVDFIDLQVASLIDSIDVSAKNLENFERQEGMELLLSSADKSSSLIEIPKNLETNEIKLGFYKFLKKTLEEGGDVSDILSPSLYGISDKVLEKFFAELEELRKQKHELDFSVKNSQDLSMYKLIEHKKKDIEEHLLMHIDGVIKIISDEQQKLKQKYVTDRNKLIELPFKERRKKNITSRFELNNSMYNFLLQKRTEAGITKASNASDVVVLDQASMYTIKHLDMVGQVSIGKALIIGFLIPVVIIFLIEFFNNKIVEVSDIEGVIGKNVIGTIGKNHHVNTLIPVAKYPSGSMAEAYRSVRTNLQFVKGDEKHKIVVLTSAVSGEGKTFNAVNLSVVVAMGGKKVLLIGMGLRKPKIHQYFSMENTKGLSTYLCGDNSWDEIISKTPYENLDFVLPGPIPPNPYELIESKRLDDFLLAMKEKYDYIFIDSAPVGIVSDSILLNRLASFYIFVVRQNYSLKSVTNLFLDLEKSGLKNMQVLFNGVSFHRGNYGYYGGKYGYRYGGYYSDEQKSQWPWYKKLYKKIKRKFKR